MIRHCVFIRFKPEITDEQKSRLFKEIDALKLILDGVLCVHAGTNVSPEAGMNKGYSDGFIIDFASASSRDNYLNDAHHQAIGARLVDAALGGLEGIFVYDMVIPE